MVSQTHVLGFVLVLIIIVRSDWCTDVIICGLLWNWRPQSKVDDTLVRPEELRDAYFMEMKYHTMFQL